MASKVWNNIFLEGVKIYGDLYRDWKCVFVVSMMRLLAFHCFTTWVVSVTSSSNIQIGYWETIYIVRKGKELFSSLNIQILRDGTNTIKRHCIGVSIWDSVYWILESLYFKVILSCYCLIRNKTKDNICTLVILISYRNVIIDTNFRGLKFSIANKK